MEDFLLNLLQLPSCNKLLDQQKCPKMAYFVTYYGLIQKKANQAGEKMIEELAIHLEKLSSNHF